MPWILALPVVCLSVRCCLWSYLLCFRPQLANIGSVEEREEEQECNAWQHVPVALPSQHPLGFRVPGHLCLLLLVHHNFGCLRIDIVGGVCHVVRWMAWGAHLLEDDTFIAKWQVPKVLRSGKKEENA